MRRPGRRAQMVEGEQDGHGGVSRDSEVMQVAPNTYPLRRTLIITLTRQKYWSPLFSAQIML